MFREVRRNKKQIMSQERCEEILKKETVGVLSVAGDNGYPYGVPISYSFINNKLYFHGMSVGHKADAIRRDNKVCFTVIETNQIVPEEYTTYFRSVIVFGKAEFIEDADKKREALRYLVEKYSADYIEGSSAEIEAKLKAVGIIVVEIDHISGKEAIEFAEAK